MNKQQRYEERWKQEHDGLSRSTLYYRGHRKEENQRRTDYNRRHSEAHAAESRKWYAENCERVKARTKTYRKNHPEIEIRHREFRLNIPPITIWLNEPFVGSSVHHMGFGFGIYIPKELHRSIWHSLTKNIRMEEINSKALEWLLK